MKPIQLFSQNGIKISNHQIMKHDKKQQLPLFFKSNMEIRSLEVDINRKSPLILSEKEYLFKSMTSFFKHGDP